MMLDLGVLDRTPRYQQKSNNEKDIVKIGCTKGFEGI